MTTARTVNEPSNDLILEVISGPKGVELNRYVVRKGETRVFGRGAREKNGSVVSIRDQHISERHFQISNLGKKIRLEDCKSTNGTSIEGTKITDQFVEDGTIFRAGQTTFQVRWDRSSFEPVVSESEYSPPGESREDRETFHFPLPPPPNVDVVLQTSQGASRTHLDSKAVPYPAPPQIPTAVEDRVDLGKTLDIQHQQRPQKNLQRDYPESLFDSVRIDDDDAVDVENDSSFLNSEDHRTSEEAYEDVIHDTDKDLGDIVEEPVQQVVEATQAEGSSPTHADYSVDTVVQLRLRSDRYENIFPNLIDIASSQFDFFVIAHLVKIPGLMGTTVPRIPLFPHIDPTGSVLPVAVPKEEWMNNFHDRYAAPLASLDGIILLVCGQSQPRWDVAIRELGSKAIRGFSGTKSFAPWCWPSGASCVFQELSSAEIAQWLSPSFDAIVFPKGGSAIAYTRHSQCPKWTSIGFT